MTRARVSEKHLFASGRTLEQNPGPLLGCGQMWSTLMGPLQKQLFLTDRGKSTPWHFWGRLAGVPKKSLSKNINFAVTPLVLTPVVYFRSRQRSTARVGKGVQHVVLARALNSTPQIWRGLAPQQTTANHTKPHHL